MAAFPTLDDVAAQVGVSARTVSRVLREEGGYSAATERRVRAAVEELRYFPNPLIRGLAARHTATIGLLGADLTDPFVHELADAVQRVAHTRGLTTFCTSMFGDPAWQRHVLGALRSSGVDGVIVLPVDGTQDEISRFAAAGTATVVIGADWSGLRLTSVSIHTPSPFADGSTDDGLGNTTAAGSDTIHPRRPTHRAPDPVATTGQTADAGPLHVATVAIDALQRLVEDPETHIAATRLHSEPATDRDEGHTSR